MSILKSILHRYNTTSQNYDTLHPETEHAQVTDFGNGVLAHLLDSTLVSAVTAVSTGSLFGKLVEKLLEASGVQYNFQNSNAWYICLGSLFGGLIIQGGWDSIQKNTYKTITLPTSFNHLGYSGSVQWDYPTGITSTQSLSYALGFDGTTGVIIGVQSAVANPIGVSYVVVGR